jgi:hypothetical protein
LFFFSFPSLKAIHTVTYLEVEEERNQLAEFFEGQDSAWLLSGNGGYDDDDDDSSDAETDSNGGRGGGGGGGGGLLGASGGRPKHR